MGEMAMPEGDAACPERDKLFDYTNDLLKKTYDKYLDGNYRVAGINLIVIGWLITSDSAQKTLRGDPFLWWIAFVISIGGAIAYFVTHRRLFFLGRSLAGELAELRPSFASKVRLNGIGRQLAVSATLVNLALYAIVWTLLFYLLRDQAIRALPLALSP
jgi:hypothetical protein